MFDKLCKKCGVTQPLEQFSRDAKRKDGLQPQCKSCFRAYKAQNRDRLLEAARADYVNNMDAYKARARNWREANPDRKLEVDTAWREANKDRKAAIDRAWYDANRDRKRAYDVAHRPDYFARNPHLPAKHQALRRSRLLNACPSWADLEAIARVYEQARAISDQTGIPHEVDHIYPLAGKHMCGLHVHNNLRVIPMVENRSKGTKIIEAA